MSRGINKVILIGNLGADPEIRYTPSGTAVANISMATSESWKDKQTGQQREEAEWHRVVFYRRLAEVVGEYLKKGAKIYIEGKLKTRKWQDQSGADRYITEIIANEMQMLDGRAGNESGAPVFYGVDPAKGYPAPNYNQPPINQNQPNPAAPAPTASTADFDDDIPF